MENKRIYVGKVPMSSTEEDLEQLFGQFGTIKDLCLIPDKFREGTQHRGFGFISFEDPQSARAAVEKGADGELVLEGCKLRVDWAREKIRD